MRVIRLAWSMRARTQRVNGDAKLLFFFFPLRVIGIGTRLTMTIDSFSLYGDETAFLVYPDWRAAAKWIVIKCGWFGLLRYLLSAFLYKGWGSSSFFKKLPALSRNDPLKLSWKKFFTVSNAFIEKRHVSPPRGCESAKLDCHKFRDLVGFFA